MCSDGFFLLWLSLCFCVRFCSVLRLLVFLLPYSNGEPMKTGGYVDGFSNWRDHIFISLVIVDARYRILSVMDGIVDASSCISRGIYHNFNLPISVRHNLATLPISLYIPWVGRWIPDDVTQALTSSPSTILFGPSPTFWSISQIIYFSNHMEPCRKSKRRNVRVACLPSIVDVWRGRSRDHDVCLSGVEASLLRRGSSSLLYRRNREYWSLREWWQEKTCSSSYAYFIILISNLRIKWTPDVEALVFRSRSHIVEAEMLKIERNKEQSASSYVYFPILDSYAEVEWSPDLQQFQSCICVLFCVFVSFEDAERWLIALSLIVQNVPSQIECWFFRSSIFLLSVS